MSDKIKAQYKALAEPFDSTVEKQLKKGGASLTYIPVSEVIARFNKVIGVQNWTMQLIHIERNLLTPDQVVAHVRLTVNFVDENGTVYTVSRDGIGGQKVKMQKSDGEPVDLGDEFKGATSDAFKKAAQGFGVALYLARDEEALYLEEQANVLPVSQEYQDFMGLVETLNAADKKLLNVFWEKEGGGRAKPKPHDYDPGDLALLKAEAIRLKLDGEYVS